MKNVSTFTKPLLAVTTALMLATSVQAFPGKHGGEGCKGKQRMHNMTAEQREAKEQKRFERMAKHLALTDTQKAQAQAIFNQNKAQKQSLHEQKKSLHEQLRTQRDNDADDANIEATHDQLYAVQKQMRQLHRAERRQLDSILTPEQRTKAEQMKEKRKERMEKRQTNG